MKLIAHYPDARLAQGAVDYMKAQGIHCVLKSVDGRHVEVWLKQGNVERASTLWAEFEHQPHAQKYQAASWQTGSTQKLFSYSGQNLNLIRRFSQLNWLLQAVFASSICIFASMVFGHAESVFGYLKFQLERPWTWLTPTLLHFSAIHLIFNLSWWLFLGEKISQKVGFNAVLSVYLFSGISSNLMQFWFVDANFGGLSGVVYGLLGFCWLYSHKNSLIEPLVSKPIVGFMLIWMIFGFTDMFFISMANWAHLFGLLSGMLLGLLWKSRV
ncbi:rhomboid family intramembrane serine protease GlpG [Pseudoalteromonas sp. T1lg65]|uniref:rhomboid family intramembrane serine protease GlpG n=1 Tax=Pseudoalteromonas sp. T1lg65 TaxID=2077101 RepID=UPI003F7A4BFB